MPFILLFARNEKKDRHKVEYILRKRAFDAMLPPLHMTRYIAAFFLGLLPFISFSQSNAAVTEQLANETALENLRAMEASLQIFSVYETFIAPRICANNTHTLSGKKRGTCRIIPYVAKEIYYPVAIDSTSTFYKIKENTKQLPDPFFSGEKPGLFNLAPKKYHLTHVGCYRRKIIRHDPADCSLFFEVLQSENPKLPPIFAVKGSSSAEDWHNNLFLGAPILQEITSIVHLLGDMHENIVGTETENVPAGLTELAHTLTEFLLRISKPSGRIIFAGHSLGGALAQELAHNVFEQTRLKFGDITQGPRVRAITFNALSYTSMLGKLKKSLPKINSADPVSKAGWKSSDIKRVEDLKKIFDGYYLSAINFHTFDDILTAGLNNSFIGRMFREESYRTNSQAGDDIMLATNRYVQMDMDRDRVILGHAAINTLYDLLFSTSAVKKGNTIQGITRLEQVRRIQIMGSTSSNRRDFLGSEAGFNSENRKSDPYEKNGGQNFDFITMKQSYDQEKRRAGFYDSLYSHTFPAQMYSAQKYYGSLDANRFARDWTPDLNPELYRIKSSY